MDPSQRINHNISSHHGILTCNTDFQKRLTILAFSHSNSFSFKFVWDEGWRPVVTSALKSKKRFLSLLPNNNIAVLSVYLISCSFSLQPNWSTLRSPKRSVWVLSSGLQRQAWLLMPSNSNARSSKATTRKTLRGCMVASKRKGHTVARIGVIQRI